MVVALWSAATAGAQAEDGEAVFGQLCAGCHAIGGGDRPTGPDLQGLPERRERAWVERFITAPDEVIASGDPIAQDLVDQYGTAMPNLGVTPAQVAALVVFLGYEAAAEPVAEPAPAAPAPPPPAGDADRGEQIFRGETSLDAGGPSCLSCHAIAGSGAFGGGQVGPNLDGAFAKYGGVQGLTAARVSLPWPTMAPIYSRNMLTAAERADLAAFIEGAPERESPSATVAKLFALSLGVALLLAIVAFVIWRGRLAGVRKPLLKRLTGK
jgi:mono/diheme cytochrome c family protein